MLVPYLYHTSFLRINLPRLNTFSLSSTSRIAVCWTGLSARQMSGAWYDAKMDGTVRGDRLMMTDEIEKSCWARGSQQTKRTSCIGRALPGLMTQRRAGNLSLLPKFSPGSLHKLGKDKTMAAAIRHPRMTGGGGIAHLHSKASFTYQSFPSSKQFFKKFVSLYESSCGVNLQGP